MLKLEKDVSPLVSSKLYAKGCLSILITLTCWTSTYGQTRSPKRRLLREGNSDQQRKHHLSDRTYVPEHSSNCGRSWPNFGPEISAKQF